MSFVDILRKLGILRFGSKNYSYSSGKDMPITAIMDDVYDEKKDLVGGARKDSDVDGKSPSKH